MKTDDTTNQRPTFERDGAGNLDQTLEALTDTTKDLAETIALDLGAFFNKVDHVRDSWAELDAALAQLEGND